MFQNPASSFDARVAQGVAFLNKVKPGWHLGVDLAKLDMGYTYSCVLAQVEGCGYGKAVSSIYCLRQFEELNLGFAHDLAKDASETDIDTHYAQLTMAWRKAIVALHAGTYVGAVLHEAVFPASAVLAA